MSATLQQPAFAAPDPADLAPLFPGYEIQSLIAVGGMGAVYCAVQKSLDRTVALKILPMEFSQDAEFCAGFEAEAKAMARLNHPNLVGVYDFGEVNGMLYIVMEFVPGQSVYHAAFGTAIDPMEVIRLVSGICDGLGHAHENGIVHRDIKPSNILLDLNAQPKIGDFGLARPTHQKTKHGEEIFGTPHYTAPEVVNSPQSVDHRADIFSVGVMLHELLTAKLPANDARSASAIVRCDPRFDAIIRKATLPVASARYFSIRDLARDLQAIAMPLTQTSPVLLPSASGYAVHGAPVHVVHSAPGRAVPGAPGRAAPGAPGRSAPGAPARPGPARRVVPPVRAKKSSGMPMVLLLLVAGAGAYFYYTKQQVKVAPPIVIATPPPAPAPTKDVITEAPPELPSVADIPSLPIPTPETDTHGTAEVTPQPIVETTQPKPTTPNPAPPKFDVPDFFDRARKVMQDRTRSTIGTNREEMKKNIQKYERVLKREVRNSNDANKDKLEKFVEATVAGWLAQDATIPEKLTGPISKLPYIEMNHAEAVLAQTGIVDSLYVDLTRQSATYILGLEKEIERRKAENDTQSISLIQKEIERTKNDPKYFSDMMLKAYATNSLPN